MNKSKPYCYIHTDFKRTCYVIPTKEHWIKILRKYSIEAEMKKMLLDERLVIIQFDFSEYGTHHTKGFQGKTPIHDMFWWRVRDLALEQMKLSPEKINTLHYREK